MKNKTTLYHFVIDQSGSMAGSEQATIAGFNTQLKTIQELKTEHPDEKYLCSLDKNKCGTYPLSLSFTIVL